ncbi:helix-turn-helix domain-containing protein [Streptomonospora alba]|uniref:helix-turn-helix domain-containing protein n=1 Tax=Streptomonospora alba TaxID=183763 RepID=UPI001470313B|nr:AraC family transcriptional regulator [Streptomonospora alba]
MNWPLGRDEGYQEDDVADDDITGEPATDGPPLLVVSGSAFDQGLVLDEHQHPCHHMIIWSATATITMRTGHRDWLVPPTHGLWIPAGTSHAAEVIRPGHSYGILLSVDRCPSIGTETTGVLITPLIRELIIHIDQDPAPAPTRAYAEALLLALLEPVPSKRFHVPLPDDPRIRTIAEALVAHPADGRDLATWADNMNTSVRTITRLFTRETGMTFAQWRARVRIRAALTHLARGRSVGATARAVGYRKPGAFSEAFRRHTGQHPAIYHHISSTDVSSGEVAV